MTDGDPAPDKEIRRYDVMVGARLYTSVTLKQLKRWITEGKLLETHLVRPSVKFSSKRKWRKAVTLKELKPLFGE